MRASVSDRSSEPAQRSCGRTYLECRPSNSARIVSRSRGVTQSTPAMKIGNRRELSNGVGWTTLIASSSCATRVWLAIDRALLANVGRAGQTRSRIARQRGD